MIKRALFTLLLTALYVVPLYSQNGEWMFETKFGIPFFDRFSIVNGKREISSNSEIIYLDKRHSSYSSNKNGGYKVRYDSDPVILPAISLSSGYRFSNIPLSVHLSVTLSYACNNLYGGPSLLRESEAVLHIMPEVRAYYMRRPKVKLYGSVAAGLRARYYAETLDGDTVSASDYRFTWQLSPFGLEVGKNWYFSFSTGFGRAWTPFIIGAGYRFP